LHITNSVVGVWITVETLPECCGQLLAVEVEVQPTIYIYIYMAGVCHEDRFKWDFVPLKCR
jgi:hypothetical protein